MSEPATKDDLKLLATKADLEQLRQELRQELRADFDRSAKHIADVMVEQLGAMVRVVDDKYSHLPAQQADLRRDLDDHRTNLRIHVRPPPPKSARKARR